jgi:hypothetical protein
MFDINNMTNDEAALFAIDVPSHGYGPSLSPSCNAVYTARLGVVSKVEFGRVKVCSNSVKSPHLTLHEGVYPRKNQRDDHLRKDQRALQGWLERGSSFL